MRPGEVLSSGGPVGTPLFRPLALASLARLARRVGAPAALDAKTLRAEIEAIGERSVEGETELRLMEVATLEDAGESARAGQARVAARARLKWRASRIRDADLRRGFLQASAPRRETLAGAG